MELTVMQFRRAAALLEPTLDFDMAAVEVVPAGQPRRVMGKVKYAAQRGMPHRLGVYVTEDQARVA